MTPSLHSCPLGIKETWCPKKNHGEITISLKVNSVILADCHRSVTTANKDTWSGNNIHALRCQTLNEQ